MADIAPVDIPGAHRRRWATNGIELDVWEAGTPGNPLVILSHGFPESAWSWRFQLSALAEAGYHVLAPNQRGYGDSWRSDNVADYGIEHLCNDLLGLVDATGNDQAIFVGHDWGALIVWDLARLYPERVRALCALSVPIVSWPMPPTQVFKLINGDNFFYITYFQEIGPAERELERDTTATLRSVMLAASGPLYVSDRPSRPAAGGGFLDGMEATDSVALPDWLPQADLDEYIRQFSTSGFFGPVSYYRNLDANYEKLKSIPLSVLTMPCWFIGGTKDMTIAKTLDTLEERLSVVPGFAGMTLIPDIGHWTQQENAPAVNEALINYFATLS